MASRIAARMGELLRPDLAKRIASGDSEAASSRLGGIMLHAQARRAARQGNWENLATSFTTYWKSAEGDRFYETYADRFERWFRGAHAPWVEAVCTAVARGSYRHLVEIGCGDGQALAYFASQIAGLPRLTGIDLNESIIHRNRARYAHQPRIHFEIGDARLWLRKHAERGMAVIAYGGVLEYFPPAAMDELLTLLAHQEAPALLALAEPLAPDFDADGHASRPGGIESSFSHPYRGMLRRMGFSIKFDLDVTIEHRWILLVAERALAQP